MNRGSLIQLCMDFGDVKASMRPRFMNRGSERKGSTQRRGPSSFNEAPIHESGKSARPARNRYRRPDASMRPRFMNRGSVTAASDGKRGGSLQ